MDVCTRLGRYVMQELTGLRGLAGGALATVVTLAIPSLYLWGMPAGSFRTFWTIFGTANQLLAALTLVGVSVWLWRTGRPVWYALLPAIFMLASTGTALVMNFWTFLRAYRIAVGDQIVGNMTNMVIAAVLFLLGLFVVVEAVRVWNKSRMAFRVRI
jgi:carbon starvation protein